MSISKNLCVIYKAVEENSKCWKPTTKIYLGQKYLLTAIGKLIKKYVDDGKKKDNKDNIDTKDNILIKGINFYGINASMIKKCLRKPLDKNKDEWDKYKKSIL